MDTTLDAILTEAMRLDDLASNPFLASDEREAAHVAAAELYRQAREFDFGGGDE